jgi:hypothetical protein
MKTTVFGHVKFCVDQSERVHLVLSRTKDKEVTLFPIHPTIDVRKASVSSVTWTHEGYIIKCFSSAPAKSYQSRNSYDPVRFKLSAPSTELFHEEFGKHPDNPQYVISKCAEMSVPIPLDKVEMAVSCSKLAGGLGLAPTFYGRCDYLGEKLYLCVHH